MAKRSKDSLGLKLGGDGKRTSRRGAGDSRNPSLRRMCGVCALSYPISVIHDHHLTPVAFGGTNDDDNRKWLCPTCHNLLHRCAENFARGHASKAAALADASFPSNPAARGRLIQWASIAARAEVLAKEQAPTKKWVTVTLRLERNVAEVLRSQGRDNRKKLKAYIEMLCIAQAEKTMVVSDDDELHGALDVSEEADS